MTDPPAVRFRRRLELHGDCDACYLGPRADAPHPCGVIRATVERRDRHRKLAHHRVKLAVDAGRAELRNRMRQLGATPAKEYRQVEAALALLEVLHRTRSPNSSSNGKPLLRSNMGRSRERLAALDTDVDRLFVIEDEYRLALIEAERAFIRRLATLIEESPPGFGAFWRGLHK